MVNPANQPNWAENMGVQVFFFFLFSLMIEVPLSKSAKQPIKHGALSVSLSLSLSLSPSLSLSSARSLPLPAECMV